MDWLRVGVLVNIYDWVVVLVGMVRIASWVGVDGLIIMMDGLVVNWLNVVRSIALNIVSDSLMGSAHIVLSHVVVMAMVTIVASMMVMIIVNILELNLVVLITVVVGLVVNFMLSLVVDEFVSNLMTLGLVALNNWLNLVNGCMLERPVV